MTAQIKVKVQRKAIVKLKVLPRTVGQVIAGDGITVDRTGGNYTVSALIQPAPPIFGPIRGIAPTSNAFLGSWLLLDPNGTQISIAGTTTQGLQEFLNAVFKPDSLAGPGFDGDWQGGQQTTAGGGGARIISPPGTVTIGPGSGKVLKAGATSLLTTSAVGSAPSLLVGAQIMADIRLDGWQIFNFGTGNAIEFKPITSVLTGAPQIIDSRFSVTTTGSVLMNSTGNQGFAASEYNIVELNASQDRTATVTISIASPGVVTWTGHGQTAGAIVFLATTGVLPTGLAVGPAYRVKTVLDANTFTLTATFGGAVINTTGTQSGVHTITAKQQHAFGFSMPTPAVGANASFNWINITHLHDIGAGADAFRWGDSAPAGSVNMSGNVFKLGISTANEAANGIHTWASGNLYISSLAGITTGKSIWLEPGALRNIFILPYNEASSTITDNSGAVGNAAGGNIIIGDGRISIGQKLVPVLTATIPSGHLVLADTDTLSLHDGGAPATVATSGSASDLTSGTLAAARGGAGTVSGLLKANGAGVVSAAVLGTDYVSPTAPQFTNIGIGTAATSQVLRVLGSAGQIAAYFQMGGSPGASTAGLLIDAGSSSTDRNLWCRTTAGADLATLYGDGGLVVGSPTGGNKGAGTVNATLYDTGNRVATLTTITPKVTVYTSSSGTHTTKANANAIKVRMIGGGGGGGGSGTGSPGTGGTGGNSTFGAGLTSNGGGGGAGSAGSTASGGTATGGDLNLAGGNGGAGSAGTLAANGGQGGASAFGGAGNTIGGGGSVGTSAQANTGAGAGGATASTGNGAGGAAGGYLEKTITSPLATYAYAVGAGGTAGTAGTSGQAGGVGGSGIIIVEEW